MECKLAECKLAFILNGKIYPYKSARMRKVNFLGDTISLNGESIPLGHETYLLANG